MCVSLSQFLRFFHHLSWRALGIFKQYENNLPIIFCTVFKHLLATRKNSVSSKCLLVDLLKTKKTYTFILFIFSGGRITKSIGGEKSHDRKKDAECNAVRAGQKSCSNGVN